MMRLEKVNGLNIKLFILFMLNKNIKKLNNIKLTEEDRQKAQKLFQDANNVNNSQLADSILMMTANEEEVLNHFRVLSKDMS